MRSALAQTFAGAVAIDPRDGQTVGMTRATGDGRYFTTCDVIVRPSHQGQQIGAAMVQRTLEELRRRGAARGVRRPPADHLFRCDPSPTARRNGSTPLQSAPH